MNCKGRIQIFISDVSRLRYPYPYDCYQSSNFCFRNALGSALISVSHQLLSAPPLAQIVVGGSFQQRVQATGTVTCDVMYHFDICFVLLALFSVLEKTAVQHCRSTQCPRHALTVIPPNLWGRLTPLCTRKGFFIAIVLSTLPTITVHAYSQATKGFWIFSVILFFIEISICLFRIRNQPIFLLDISLSQFSAEQNLPLSTCVYL